MARKIIKKKPEKKDVGAKPAENPELEKKLEGWQKRMDDKGEQKKQEEKKQEEKVKVHKTTPKSMPKGDYALNSGMNPIFKETTKELTEDLPLLTDDYQDIALGLYLNYKRQNGKKKVDGLAKMILDAGKDFVKSDKVFGLTATNEKGKRRLDNWVRQYVPFDENMIQKALDKRLRKTGYLTTNAIIGAVIQPMSERFYQSEESFITGPLQQEIRDTKKFDQFKDYMLGLGKELGQEIEKDDLAEIDREYALRFYSQMTQRKNG